MRKLHPSRAALAAWALLACATATTLGAQTTFRASNDPSAMIEVTRDGEAVTRVTVTQRPTTAGYTAPSTDVVLRDERTGIAYRPAGRRTRDAAAGLRVTEYEFSGLDGGELVASLVDAHIPGRGLMVSGIELP